MKWSETFTIGILAWLGVRLVGQPVDPNTPVNAVPYVIDGSPAGQGVWMLTFSDEFGGTAINSRWNTSIAIDKGLNKSNQTSPYHWYQRSSDVSLNGSGQAVIQFVREANDPSDGYPVFSAGRLDTEEKFSQAYGYFEASIQLPPTQGTQAAWWLFPPGGIASGSQAATGGAEYDILESNQQLNGYSTDIHYSGYTNGIEQSLQEYEGDSDTASGDGLPIDGHPFPNGNTISSGFHIFGFEWASDHASFYYDGVRYRTVTDPTWISMIEEFPIVSGGMISPWDRGNIFSATLPYYMYVDYVRVWARPIQVPTCVKMNGWNSRAEGNTNGR